MDVGIYCLQTTRMITGEDPIWINATEVKTDAVKFKEVDETVLWQTKFPSGVVSNCVCTYSANGLAGFRAATTRGWFGLDPAYFYNGNRGRRSDGPEINFPVDRSVRHRARRLRGLHHQQEARRRCRARWALAGREVPDGDLRVDQEGPPRLAV